jgi:hypothetical protein
MRTYTRNSPQAAGRIVALVLLADGNVCRSEIDALSRHPMSAALGLTPEAMGRLLQELCEDMLDGMCTTGSMLACLDDATLASVLREIDDPELQQDVLNIASAAADADRHVAEAEHFVLDAARRHWGVTEQPTTSDALQAA